MSSFFDIDDLPGPSNRKASNREIYISGIDSGYEGSNRDEDEIADQEGAASSSNVLSSPRGGRHDRDIISAEDSERLLNFQIQQLHYNENRAALARAITTVMDMLKELQAMNHKWPAQYPQFRGLNTSEIDSDRPGIRRIATDVPSPTSPVSPTSERRLGKAKEKAAEDIEPAKTEVPRLMSSEISHDFNVLKLDLKLGALSPVALVQSLEKSAIASLLDGKIAQAMKHLVSLRERIEDTSSKVLVTGDLNAGKSTFCNALLRRDILPEDQQPCTNVFCEVLDSQLNHGVEEVHAIRRGVTYDRKDESTYDLYPLSKLEELASESEPYVLLKVYIEDKRPSQESLLRNGVVDIALIDAPGLNMDSMQTTAVFARQEEIDVVVFVVSAENHFTLSAKEFIWNAAHEKAFIFIVVNRFDNIRDKNRCERLILQQVAKLSPRTYDDASDLVHFVSSNEIPTDPGDDGDGDDGNSPPSGGDGGSHPDFDQLERCLRNFVLEKRALSKLAPAKTYLMNLLVDVEALGSYNEDLSQSEVSRLQSELDDITPLYEKTVAESVKIGDEIETNVNKLVNNVYDHSRYKLESVIDDIGSKCYVEYPGLLSLLSYSADTRDAMLVSLQQSVIECEEFARKKTTNGFNVLKAMGLRQFDSTQFYSEKVFNNSLMFSRRRDILARGSISVDIELSDFLDLDQREKIAGMGMSLTVATIAGTGVFSIPTTFYSGIASATRIIGLNNIRQWILPAMGLVLVAGAAYIVSEIPNVVPRKISKKLHMKLEALDYVHVNALRISTECRNVLRVPSEDIRRAFQAQLEEQSNMKLERTKQISQADEALKYFTKLHKSSTSNLAMISKFDLESAPLGLK
ncbi:uncharacterized protein V1516DRAFT_637880 [Lipomyces oligophaga]|uniref:uncharacterized protein n=1 Tax=Lipomyces oligophaga TaxID=45792 RepID=UPI0034CE72FF